LSFFWKKGGRPQLSASTVDSQTEDAPRERKNVMHKKPLSPLLLLVGLSLLAGCHHRHNDKEKIAMKLPQGTPKRPQGSTALTVNPGAAQPFTQQDVVSYFKTHNLPKNDSDISQFQVSALEFLTSQQVSQRLQGEPTGLEANDKIGFVTLTGQFVFTGPPGRSARFNQAYAAFDARTGNLLMIGTLDEKQEQTPAKPK
jgi:hypothetical protein